MEFPPDKETMRSFLGMINYLNGYSALSAHLAAPLSSLTHQATDYKPGKVTALPYFNVNAETTLQTDASKNGLGACLIQNGKVVCYASRALTKTEQNYQNLEREALGTIWGMQKFHYFLYGKEFTLETDQKPLVSICHASARPPASQSTMPHFPSSLDGMRNRKARTGLVHQSAIIELHPQNRTQPHFGA